MMTIKGTLFLYSETGTEGGYWAIQDERFIQPPTEDWPHPRWSYDGLHCLTIDFHYFLLRSGRLRNEFDRETQQRLVKRGIVGYLWGATVALERGVVVGHVVLTSDVREKALKSKKSIVVELQKPFDVITKDFEGIADTHTDWTESET